MAKLRMFQSALEKALDRAERIREKRDQFEADMNRAEARLQNVLKEQPEAIFEARMLEPTSNGEAPPDPRENIRALLAQEDLCRKELAHTAAVLQKFNSELVTAMRDVIAAEADEADRAADQFDQNQLQPHLEELNRRKQALEEWAGAPYMPAANHTRAVVDLIHMSGKTILGESTRVTIPTAEALQIQLAELRAKAQFLRARQVRAHGRAMGYTLETIRSQTREPLVIGPSEASLQHAMEQAEAEAWDKWRKSGDDQIAQRARGYQTTRIHFTLHWKDGVIQHCVAKVEPVFAPFSVTSISELAGGALYAS
jgi:hypothetical protein